jgi:hypothetical protein
MLNVFIIFFFFLCSLNYDVAFKIIIEFESIIIDF